MDSHDEYSQQTAEYAMALDLCSRKMDFSCHTSETGLFLTYRDNGVGISEEDKKKRFKKGFGKHTGLGLYLSRSILAITGNSITETGVPGTGVQFEILIPFRLYRFPIPR
ncbi:ATP-binding protein [Methanoregula sp.]|jgi:signal transduction histidine kinase|uniref:ATP-binding protein n=1 Tax=Methanoregula sp. TaxID=2052170 RepID=UPI003BAFBFAF